MNNETTKALTVYVGEKKDFSSKFKDFFNKIKDRARIFFNRRKRLLVYLLFHYLFFAFLGACLSSSFVLIPYYIDLSFFCDRMSVVFAVSFVLESLFGFTVFSKPVSVFVNSIVAFSVGVLQFVSIYFFFLNERFDALIFALLVSFFSFLKLLHTSECFLFSRKATEGKTAFKDLKAILKYFLFCVAIIYCLYFVFKLFINFLMLG